MTNLRTALLALALTVAACGPTTAPAASRATPSPTVPPSASPPTPAASPSRPAAMELPVGSALEPGRYTRAAFVPRITFEVAGGWRGAEAFQGFFDIQQDMGSPDVIAVQFARPEGFFAAEGALVDATTAEAAATAVQANPALTVLDSSPSTMSGLDGLVIEVENPATASGPAQVLQVPPGPLSIDPARRLWIAVFDTPEGVVAVLVGGSVARWDEALLAAEPVLETVTIGR